MKSKEALKYIEDCWKLGNMTTEDELDDVELDDAQKKVLEPLKRDLEVLEILKRMIVLETMDDDKREWEQFNLYFNTKGKMKKLELNDEDWNKLKEWING